MSDLIKELRDLAASEEVADRAADELERLQRENEELRKDKDYETYLTQQQLLRELQRENEEYEVQQRAATAVMHDASAKIKNLEAELAALKESAEPVAWMPMKNGKVVWSEVQGGCITTDTDTHMRPVYTTPPTATALVEDFKRRAVEVCRKNWWEFGKYIVEEIESLSLIEGEK